MPQDFALRKKYAWIAFAWGSWSTLMCLLLIVSGGFPSARDWSGWFYFLSSPLFLIVSALKLRTYYRLEPNTGSWHLHLSDLLAVSFFFGLILCVWRELWPRSVVDGGIIFAITATAAFVVCLFLSGRKGFEQPFRKCLHALGMLLSGIGVIVLLMFLAVPVTAAFIIRGSLESGFYGAVFFIPTTFEVDGLVWFFRIGLLCYPVGYLFKRLAVNQLPISD